MRAARIHAWNSAPSVDEIGDPERAPGETLVRVEAATLSHLDLTVASGEFGLRPELPYVPGVEGAGVVVESDRLAAGTQVLFREGAVGLSGDGTWREFAAVPDAALAPLAVPLDPPLAATFFGPVTTACVALHDIARVRAGETVVVTGATGAVGSVAVQLALDAGATVVGVVSRGSKLGRLLPGVPGVALDDPDAVAELAGSRRADVLLDTIGGAGLAERAGWVRAGGRAVCVGYTAGDRAALDLSSWLLSDVALLPVNLIAREARAQEVADELLPRVADGSIRIDREELPLERVADGLARRPAGQVRGRAVIRF